MYTNIFGLYRKIEYRTEFQRENLFRRDISSDSRGCMVKFCVRKLMPEQYWLLLLKFPTLIQFWNPGKSTLTLYYLISRSQRVVLPHDLIFIIESTTLIALYSITINFTSNLFVRLFIKFEKIYMKGIHVIFDISI